MAPKIKKSKGVPGLRKKTKRKAGAWKTSSQQDTFQQAMAYYRAGRFHEAEVLYRQILAAAPDHPDALHFMGMLAFEAEKYDIAIELINRAIRNRPDYAEAYNNLGTVFNEQGKLDEAAACFRKAISLKPGFAMAHSNMGSINRQLGKMDDAAACYRKALSFAPNGAKVYRDLTTVVKYNTEDEDVRAMETIFYNRGAAAADRIELGFALGKVFEDMKDYNKSFAFILEANRLKRKSYQYSLEKDHDLFLRIKKIFSPDFLSSHIGSGNHDKTPIFIVGMPRSGTSLVEQILASHPAVFGANELAIIANLVNDICLKEKTSYPECLLNLGTAGFERMGTDYVEKLREYSNDAEHITDKLPHNFFYVGLIRTILPEAKVVHCTRNPMDTCYSIFKNYFEGGGHHYAYDMVELGRYYNLYRDLMAHWDRVLPGFMYAISYEDLINDQRSQTESLLDYCGLPWNEACLTFHETERRVSTVSLAQVRRPIYKDSVELWKRYEKQLEPLRKAIHG